MKITIELNNQYLKLIKLWADPRANTYLFGYAHTKQFFRKLSREVKAKSQKKGKRDRN